MVGKWTGFRFPARILTPDEVSILTPICNSCSLPGLTVELQVPLENEAMVNQPLIEFTNDQLKFYCAYHSPIKLPPEVVELTDYACYTRLLVEVYCPHRAHKKYITTCLMHEPRCLKRCDLIRKLVGDVPRARLQEIIERGRAIDLRRKMEKANGSKEGT